LSGTPDAGTGGTYPVTFSASNGESPDAAQTFRLTVVESPAITSNAAATFTAGKQGSFRVSATGFPAPTFTQSGALPSGVTFDGSTGVLSGIPDAGTGGTYPITLTASNGVGVDATQSLRLTVNEAVAFTSTGSTTFTVGVAGSFTISATGFPPPTFTESGALPPGLVFTANANGTATLAGTPAAASGGIYAISISADNGVVDPTQHFSLTVNESSGFTGAASATFTVGKPGRATIATSGFPKPTLMESGALPSGVTFAAATGTLSGTPAAGTAGRYALKITAHNGIGPDSSETFILTVVQTVGYAMVDSAGHVFSFGSMSHPGDAPTDSVTGIARTADTKGYWIVNRTGQIYALGDARYHGGLGPNALKHGEIVTSIASTPMGAGYWLFTTSGRVFPFGDAVSYGDLRAVRLAAPVVGAAATPTGHGYYIVARDGGVFTFGDAHFRGSTGAMKLNQPIVAITPTRDNKGYWLGAADGGVFSFNAPFHGSMGGARLSEPIVGMAPYADGYLMVAADGGAFNFSKAPFFGSLSGKPTPAAIVSATAIG
jgi:hypothetical protein